MELFFAWLNHPGPYEEIAVCVLLLMIFAFVFLILLFILSKGSFKIKDFSWKSNDCKDENDKKDAKQNNKKDDVLCGSRPSIIASQDYRIISLIIQSHGSRVRDEMRTYCIKNGLDKKSKDLYMLYVDEKKNLYISQLKEMINHEYMSYDSLSLSDIYEIIDDVKETIMSRLEKLYIKIRDISVEEHIKMKSIEEDLVNAAAEELKLWSEKTYTSQDEKEKILKKIIITHALSFEKLTCAQRTDILDKQLQKITITKNDLRDIILNKVIDKMNEKIK